MSRVQCKACGNYQDAGREACDECGGSSLLFARRSTDRAAAVIAQTAKLDLAVQQLAASGVSLARLLELVQASYDRAGAAVLRGPEKA